MDYQEIFKKILLSQPHCIIGKKGITDEMIQHIHMLLKKYKIIKIKMLKSFIGSVDIKHLVKRIADNTESYVVDIRGKTFILSLHKINKKK